MMTKTSTMNRSLILVQEPNLEFGFLQRSTFPKDGLLLFGPPTDELQPTTIRFGLVGTSRGVALFKEWLVRVRGVISSKDPEKAHFQYWPGFSAVFNATWPTAPLAEYVLDEQEVSRTIRLNDRHHALYKTTGLIENVIARHCREEERQPDVWFVVIPDEVHQYGRPNSAVPVAMRESSGRTLGKSAAIEFLESGDLFDDFTEEARIYQFDLDFHAQLKARLLGKAVLQIIRESTLSGGEYIENRQIKTRKMQDPATTAWNLCTTAYFKAQGSPWRLADVRKGVCYVGLVYKRDETMPTHENVCCGAQMFLDSGDGVVFRGAMGPWASADNREYHLSTEAAEDLMRTVINAYAAKHGTPPSEIFIHGQTDFDDKEWDGFRQAVPGDTQLTGVKIRKSNRLKVYRAGKKPLVRGTAWILSSRKAYLWASGYVPRLSTYPGWEVPNPLEIDVQRGEARIETVVEDVLGLTKLNYNACLYGDSKPVTLRFADVVGNILTATPDKSQPPLPFRYYI